MLHLSIVCPVNRLSIAHPVPSLIATTVTAATSPATIAATPTVAATIVRCSAPVNRASCQSAPVHHASCAFFDRHYSYRSY